MKQINNRIWNIFWLIFENQFLIYTLVVFPSFHLLPRTYFAYLHLLSSPYSAEHITTEWFKSTNGTLSTWKWKNISPKTSISFTIKSKIPEFAPIHPTPALKKNITKPINHSNSLSSNKINKKSSKGPVSNWNLNQTTKIFPLKRTNLNFPSIKL